MKIFDPKISVVMSTYNGKKFLQLSIESILNQSFCDFEFIIINDGSTDDTQNILNHYANLDKRINIISQKNNGLAKSLNIGIRAAKTNFIARMDDDDCSYPKRLEKQYNFLLNNPDYIICGSNANIIDEDGGYIFTTKNHIDDNRIRKNISKTQFMHSSVMFRKDIAVKAGLYDENVNFFIEDRLLWYRMAAYGKLVNIKDPLIKYRFRRGSISLHYKSTNGKINKLFDDIINNRCPKKEIGPIAQNIKNSITKEEIEYSYNILMLKKYIKNKFSPLKILYYINKLVFLFFCFKLKNVVKNKKTQQ